VKTSTYVRRVMASMLNVELTTDRRSNPGEGWMFGGLEIPRDNDRIAEIEAELKRWIRRLSR
jgi:hypothetical protein